MQKQRVPETDQGITGEFNVQMYDIMMKNHRDRGWIETRELIKAGINRGIALEIGPGPGYLGLEWLKQTHNTRLIGLEISPDMIQIAKKNAAAYGLNSRIQYVSGDGKDIEFEDAFFEAVFSNGSLHEWARPVDIFNHIIRILKPNGKFFVSDLRRDISFFMKWFMRISLKPRALKPGLISSINAAYTKKEIHALLQQTNIENYIIKTSPIGLIIQGEKA